LKFLECNEGSHVPFEYDLRVIVLCIIDQPDKEASVFLASAVDDPVSVGETTGSH
jgi:hypothetical protein